jgi:predicted SprT family Zn-dependent metalloprotease
MNLHEAQILARDLMTTHGLAGWSFRFDHARRRFGCCNYTHKRISLSRPLTLLNPIEQVRDTILHEIAHAMTPGKNHGPEWRAACARIGAKPARCYTDDAVVSPPRAPARYQIGCPACDWWADRRRVVRGKKYQCKRCGGAVVLRAAG